jgi:hypothetical protein
MPTFVDGEILHKPWVRYVTLLDLATEAIGHGPAVKSSVTFEDSGPVFDWLLVYMSDSALSRLGGRENNARRKAREKVDKRIC